MKKIITLIFLSITVFCSFAQSNTKQKKNTATSTKTDLSELPSDVLKMLQVYMKENNVMFDKKVQTIEQNNEPVTYFENLTFKLIDKRNTYGSYIVESTKEKIFTRESSIYKFDKFEMKFFVNEAGPYVNFKFNTRKERDDFYSRIGKNEAVEKLKDGLTISIWGYML